MREISIDEVEVVSGGVLGLVPLLGRVVQGVVGTLTGKTVDDSFNPDGDLLGMIGSGLIAGGVVTGDPAMVGVGGAVLGADMLLDGLSSDPRIELGPAQPITLPGL